MLLDDDQCYRALVPHDARFDGRFFVGVGTTGIYCRPVCTARTPHRHNCRFFPSAAAAEAVGFRPCLRCRPELAPGHAAVDANRRLAQSAARLIEDGRRHLLLGGPIRIAQISGQVASIGFVALIHLAGVLSVSIGLLNLFPIPLLDGGHLLFYAIEATRGRPLSERAQEVGFRIGLAIVVMLMIFATFNDIVHLTTS